MRFLLAILFTLFTANAFAATQFTNSYTVTNVTTGAYVQLVAATPVGVNSFQVCDTSGKIIIIAVGASGSEVNEATVQVSGCTNVPLNIPSGSRIALKALDANATSGWISLSLLPRY